MPLVPSVVRAVLAPWSVAALIVSSSSASALAQKVPQGAEQPAKASPWPCRLIPVPSVRRLVEQGMERSATIRRQCEELAAARAVVVLEWGATMDSQSQARTVMEVRAGVVVASVKLPPLGDIIVLMAHELQHVIEQTRGLDLQAEAKRAGSGVWQSFGSYETQAAIDVSRQVAEELRAYSRAARRRDRIADHSSLRITWAQATLISQTKRSVMSTRPATGPEQRVRFRFAGWPNPPGSR